MYLFLYTCKMETRRKEYIMNQFERKIFFRSIEVYLYSIFNKIELERKSALCIDMFITLRFSYS